MKLIQSLLFSFIFYRNIKEEDKQSIIEKNAQSLKSYASRLIELISSEDTLIFIPREIKALCRFILDSANEAGLEKPSQFIGGFFILRFLSPLICVPESHISLNSSRLTDKVRRNLVLLAKVIQSLANGTNVTKEPYMSIMMDFFKENTSKMESFLYILTKDDVQDESTPFSDLISSEETPISNEDLIAFHRILYDSLGGLHELAVTSEEPDLLNNFIQSIETLGVPPDPPKNMVFLLTFYINSSLFLHHLLMLHLQLFRHFLMDFLKRKRQPEKHQKRQLEKENKLYFYQTNFNKCLSINLKSLRQRHRLLDLDILVMMNIKLKSVFLL